MFLPLQKDSGLGYFKMDVSVCISFIYLLMHLYGSILFGSSCL